jgi:hypothetical protein
MSRGANLTCSTPARFAELDESVGDPRNFLMSKYTAFRCPEDLLELAKVKAKKDRRSLSNYIITLIERDVMDMAPDDETRQNGGAKDPAKGRR